MESLWLSGEHQSTKSQGLRFNSTWVLRIFSLFQAHNETKTSFSISLLSSKLTIYLALISMFIHKWSREEGVLHFSLPVGVQDLGLV